REMHELLLRNSRQLKPATLLILAEQAGLDLNRFDADRRSLWALEVLTADEKLAAQSGIEGVPVVFLNGRRMSTWRYDFLKSQIEKVLPRQ
ncbi:MAG: DsbA family protein, partial [Deltaproteobacteria bacterium]|nr:DsbA family protein [Deltaproteobacteria bacterium]